MFSYSKVLLDQMVVWIADLGLFLGYLVRCSGHSMAFIGATSVISFLTFAILASRLEPLYNVGVHLSTGHGLRNSSS